MKNKVYALFLFLLVVSFSCSKENAVSEDSKSNAQSDLAIGTEASSTVDISGIGFFATEPECGAIGAGGVFATRVTGDLEGCLIAFIDEFGCQPSGTYREKGSEHFIGTYKGQPGEFWTKYQFEAKYEGCDVSGAPLGSEIFGRCEHPIIKGSGTGVFEGATGRLDFKDDVEAGNFPYRGHIKFQ